MKLEVAESMSEMNTEMTGYLGPKSPYLTTSYLRTLSIELNDENIFKQKMDMIITIHTRK